MSKKKPHSATPALKILEDAGISHEVHTFSAGNDHFGEHAVAELGTDPERVFKTLVIDLSAGKGPKRRLAVCCLPVTYQLSLKVALAEAALVARVVQRPSGAQTVQTCLGIGDGIGAHSDDGRL